MYQQILYEVDDPIALLQLNRPERLNAWTDQMGREVKHALAAAEADPSVVVIVLSGAGRGFCSGADLADLDALSSGREMQRGVEWAADPGDSAMNAGFRGAYTYLLSIRKPIIAAINGPCAGMAVPIALCTDIRFASDRALFTTAFVQRGLVAEWAIAWLLPRLVGPGHAMDLLLSGRKVDAAEAERMGLVNKVVPHDELLPHVKAYAREMAANGSPRSMRVMKRQVYEALETTLDQESRNAARLMVESFDAPDFKEGVQAFLEKRPPRFART